MSTKVALRRSVSASLTSIRAASAILGSPVQVVVLSGIDKIAKGFYVDGLDLCEQVRARGDLEASRKGDSQNENQRQESGDDDYDGQSHCCSRRSSSRFQISRLCSGSGTTDFVRVFWGTSR